MQKKTENKIRMFKAVRQVLLNFVDVWKANLGFKETADDFEKGVKAVDDIRTQSDTPTNGITDDKEVMYEDLVDSIMELSGPFASLAKRASNKELVGKVSFTDSYLKSLTENELAQKGKDLAQLALQYKEGLTRYNVAEVSIKALNDQATAFGAKIPEPRETVSVRVSAKISLNQLIRTNSLLLKEELDGLVDQYRRSNPDFWNAYFTARKIVDYGIRHEKKEEKKEEKKSE